MIHLGECEFELYAVALKMHDIVRQPLSLYVIYCLIIRNEICSRIFHTRLCQGPFLRTYTNN